MTEIADGTYTAVVDRFEDELAVLLVEGESELVGELVVETMSLPVDGQHVDAVLTVEVQDGKLDDVWYEADKTVERKEDVESRFDRLSERPPSDDDEE